MKILAFDTCLDKMYVALGDEKEILSSKIVETTETTYHSAFLISTIAKVLEENNLKPQDIDVIATNIGPGSFTGIRACTTVARVMAQGLDKKTVGVSSLEILSLIREIGNGKWEMEAPLTSHLSPLTPKTLVALDARKEMAYVAIYENGVEIQAPKAMLLEDIKKMIAEEDYFVITDNKLLPILGGISYQNISSFGNYDLGKNLIKIAAAKLKTNYDTNWQKLLPLYIQPPALHVKKEVK